MKTHSAGFGVGGSRAWAAAILVSLTTANCYGYGGWDYAHPYAETLHVISKSFSDLWLFLILYGVFMVHAARIIQISRSWTNLIISLGVIGLLAFFGVGILLPAFIVMGSPGPAHLAGDIFNCVLDGLLVTGAIRVVGMIARQRLPTSRVLHWSSYAVLALELALIAGVVLAALVLTGPRMAKDGEFNCQHIMIHAPQSYVDNYRELTGQFPTNLVQVAKRLGFDESNTTVFFPFKCPYCGLWYEIQIEPKTGKRFIVCPYHGFREQYE